MGTWLANSPKLSAVSTATSAKRGARLIFSLATMIASLRTRHPTSSLGCTDFSVEIGTPCHCYHAAFQSEPVAAKGRLIRTIPCWESAFERAIQQRLMWRDLDLLVFWTVPFKKYGASSSRWRAMERSGGASVSPLAPRGRRRHGFNFALWGHNGGCPRRTSL